MIEIQDLSFHFHPEDDDVFSNINLSVPDGQIVGLFGENGAGKTTLLKCIMEILKTKRGSISIDGKRPSQQYERLSYITEQGSFFPYLTPKKYGRFLQDFFPTFDWAYFERLIDFFELDDKAIGKMSKGQKAKVEIAAGMAKRTPYIIMDEPFTGKDMFTRQDFLKTIAGSLTGEETIIICTHELEEAVNFIDRAVILHNHKVGADILMDDLRAKGRTLPELMKEVTGYKEDRYKKLLD